MHELPAMLIFMCVPSLCIFAAAESSRIKGIACGSYFASAVMASILLLGLLQAWIGVLVALAIFAAWVLVNAWACVCGEADIALREKIDERL